MVCWKDVLGIPGDQEIGRTGVGQKRELARKPRVCWRHHYVGEDLQKYRALLALIEQKAQEEVENKRKLQEVGAKICFPVWLSSRFLASFCIFS